MTIESNGTSSTSSASSTGTATSYGYTESYITNYASSTTYKVTITTTESGQPASSDTIWILKDGTILAVNIAGFNFTGATAQQYGNGAFVGFTLQIEADSEIGTYTASNYFHTVGASTTVSIGPTKVSVTSYSANTLPEIIATCTGSTTLTAYAFSVGMPQGTSSPLVTYEHFAGSDTTGGQTDTFDYVLQVTSITLT